MMSDMSPTAVTALDVLCIALISLLVIAWYCVRKAYDEGNRAGRQTNEYLLQDLRQKLAQKINESEIERQQAAEAMEQQWIQHEADQLHLRESNKRLAAELADTQQRNADMLHDLQQLQEDGAKLQKQGDQLEAALSIIPSLTSFDATIIETMAEQLRAASPALHAQQQFKAAKACDKLAPIAITLADKIRRAQPSLPSTYHRVLEATTSQENAA